MRFLLLKDKLKHIKNFEFIRAKCELKSCSAKVEVVRSPTPPTGAQGKANREGVEAKKRNCLIDYSFKPGWPFMMIVLRGFNFLTLRHL